MRIVGLLLFLWISVCRVEAQTPILAPPGQKHILQILWIYDKKQTLDGTIDLSYLKERLKARVEAVAAQEEKWGEWNAKTEDIIILGPGRAQDRWCELRPTRNPERRVFAILQSSKKCQQAPFVYLKVDLEAQKRYEKFFSLKEKQQLKPQMDWSKLLVEEIESSKKQPEGSILSFGFASGFLTLQQQGLLSSELKKRKEEFLIKEITLGTDI